MYDIDSLRERATKIVKEYFNSTYDVDTVLHSYPDNYINVILEFNGR